MLDLALFMSPAAQGTSFSVRASSVSRGRLNVMMTLRVCAGSVSIHGSGHGRLLQPRDSQGGQSRHQADRQVRHKLKTFAPCHALHPMFVIHETHTHTHRLFFCTNE
jgi:hypothetical protein